MSVSDSLPYCNNSTKYRTHVVMKSLERLEEMEVGTPLIGVKRQAQQPSTVGVSWAK